MVSFLFFFFPPRANWGVTRGATQHWKCDWPLVLTGRCCGELWPCLIGYSWNVVPCCVVMRLMWNPVFSVSVGGNPLPTPFYITQFLCKLKGKSRVLSKQEHYLLCYWRETQNICSDVCFLNLKWNSIFYFARPGLPSDARPETNWLFLTAWIRFHLCLNMLSLVKHLLRLSSIQVVVQGFCFVMCW